jgi:steroid 5-alpha reductase family enzyme
LLAMAVGSSVKQILWLTYICREEFTLPASLAVAAFNTAMNAGNALLLFSAATSATLASPSIPIPWTSQSVSLPIAVGTILYAVGIVLETVPELQRKWFKDQPENKGKICRTGLWGLARHINYGGYTLWRGGYSLAAGGWIAGAAQAAFQAYNFTGRAASAMDEYMTGKYGEQWRRYKNDVQYLLLPGIY